MLPWLAEVEERVDRIDARNAQAFGRCEAGIRAIAATNTGGAAESAEGFLGNLHALNTRYGQAIGDLKNAVNAGNSIQALQLVDTLDAITTTTENLADAIETQLASRLAEADRDRSRLVPEPGGQPDPPAEDTPESIGLGGDTPLPPSKPAAGLGLGVILLAGLLVLVVSK